MTFLIAGLQEIPQILYEAARVDGANAWQQFRFVTLPQLRRQLAFVLVADTVGNFLVFAPVQILTRGGPQHSTNLVMFEIYTRAFQTGDVMYRGPVRMLSASTVPSYGFEFKMFPYAGQRRGMMQLRAASIGAATVLSNLPKCWNGTFRHPDVHDFLCDSATVRLERPMPMQIAGDAGGYRDHVRFDVADRSVDLVDFTATLN